MNANVGIVDRVVRAAFGIALISFVFWGPQTQWAPLAQWGWIGIVPLLSALIGFCPVYGLLGVRTCRAAARR